MSGANAQAIGGVLHVHDRLESTGSGQAKLDCVQAVAAGLGADDDSKASSEKSKEAHAAALSCVEALTEAGFGSVTLDKATAAAADLLPPKADKKKN